MVSGADFQSCWEDNIKGILLPSQSRSAKHMTIKRSTLKTLWAASGNQCGHPDCEEKVADTELEIVIGEICHIRAQSEGGPRYDPNLGEDEVDAYSNLILLCPTHHTYVDKNPEEYPIEELERWKELQEDQESTDSDISDELLTELQLTDSKLATEVEVSISNAKDRYTPELHVDTSASDIFEPLGRTDTFNENVENRLEDLDDEASSLFTESYISVLEEADKRAYQNLREAVEKIPELLRDIDQVSEEIPIKELDETLEQADEATQELEPGLRTLKEEAEEETRESTEKRTLDHFRRVRSEVYNLQRFAGSKELQVAETPALKLLGKAGMGKTHLLCNVAKTRIEEGYPTILLLGENFSERDIWTQIIERFGLNCTTEDFLSALNSLGRSRGVRSLLMIDALNESPDPRIWARQLPGVLRKLEEYPYIGICVSCRTGYEELVIPDSIKEKIVETRHGGFRDVEYDAVRKFFDEHGIEHSSIPVLKREFQVPLFLKLFCENLERRGQSRISHGPEGLTQIFEGYINGVNDRLWRRLEYDPSENKVRKAVDALAREMAEQGGGTKHLPRGTAKEIIDDFLPGRRYPESLYRHILSEGVISEVVPFEEDASESVRFSYDKFSDHILAQQYLDLYVEDDFGEAVSENDNLQEIFDNPNLYPGLIQAFAIHLPEQEGVEIFEQLDSDEILTPFIKSLVWRDPETLTDSDGRLKEEVENYLWDEIELLDDLHELWRVLLTLATSPDHPMNAEYLHEVLAGFDVADRDADWSKFLHEEFKEETSEVFRLINWGFSLEHEPIESLELKRLMSISLSWFFSCPNRYVRDRATKSMVNVVGSDLEIYIDLIERFQGVNDSYILERVYTATYGGILRHRKHDAVTELADVIYELEFADDDPTPHFLARDYSRGIIELANHQVDSYAIDLDKVRPPYDSSFSIDIPTPEELQEQVNERLKDADTELESHFWIGLTGTGFEGDGYSDFARYIVGTNHDSSHVHGYDLSGAEALRWITKRVFELGWHPDYFGDFDHYLNRWSNHGRGTRKPERFSKKYQWIAYYELVAWLIDNCDFSNPTTESRYNGPWDYFDRDIDPSVLDPEATSDASLDEVVEYDCCINDTSLEDWIEDHEEFPELDSVLDISVSNEDWVPLHGIYKWRAEEDEDSKLELDVSRLERDVFCRIDPVVVGQAEKQELVDWVIENWVESEDIKSTLVSLPVLTQVFRGEYPWHPLVENRWEDDVSVIRGCPVDVENTALDLLWEAEYDCSVDEKYGMYGPSPYLADLLDLEWIVDTKEFKQQSSNPVRVADLSEAEGLYDRVNSLSMVGASRGILDELESEGLDIIWVVQGEKRIISGSMAGNKMGQTQTRGVFHLGDDGEFVGESESDFYSWG